MLFINGLLWLLSEARYDRRAGVWWVMGLMKRFKCHVYGPIIAVWGNVHTREGCLYCSSWIHYTLLLQDHLSVVKTNIFFLFHILFFWNLKGMKIEFVSCFGDNKVRTPDEYKLSCFLKWNNKSWCSFGMTRTFTRKSFEEMTVIKIPTSSRRYYKALDVIKWVTWTQSVITRVSSIHFTSKASFQGDIF